MTLARATAHAVLALSISMPAAVSACPVCQDPRDANQAAFLAMTVFMSLLPLGLIGGVVLYLWRSAVAPDADAPMAASPSISAEPVAPLTE